MMQRAAQRRRARTQPGTFSVTGLQAFAGVLANFS